MPSLKIIEIGGDCFRNARVFEIDNMSSLESVSIDSSSFYISSSERNDGRCRICNCPNLKDISFNSSFIDFKYFEISNLKSLKSIYFGNNFYYADFVLQRNNSLCLDK